MRKIKPRGQGSIEYLVVLGAVVIISIVVTGVLSGGIFPNTSQVLRNTDQTWTSIGQGGISISDLVVDNSGNGLVVIKNTSGDSYSVESISSGSGRNTYTSGSNIAAGGSGTFSMRNLSGKCQCAATDKTKTCTFDFNYLKPNGIEKTITVTKIVDCVTNADSNTAIIRNNMQPLFLTDVKPVDYNGSEYLYAIAVDSDGNIYAAGAFGTYGSGTARINFGNSVIKYSKGYNLDFFIAKYDSSGNIIWAATPSGSGYAGGTGSVATSLYVDTSGNVYVSGTTSTDINFSDTVRISRPAGISTIAYIVKYSQAGVPQWVKYPSAQGGSSTIEEITTDSSGNIYLVGEYTKYVYWGKDISNNDLNLNYTTNYNVYTLMLLMMNSSGSFLWGKSSYGEGSQVTPSSITTDSSSVYVVGSFYNADFNLGSGYVFTHYAPLGNYEYFAARFDSSGNPTLAITPSGSTGSKGQSVVTDSSGNIYLCGILTGDVNFNSSYRATGTASIFFYYLAKYNASGTIQWVKWPTPTSSPDGRVYCDSMGLDSSNKIYILSEVLGSAAFGNDYNVTVNPEYYLVKYDSDSAIGTLWVKDLGYESSLLGNSPMFVDSSKYVYAGVDSNSFHVAKYMQR